MIKTYNKYILLRCPSKNFCKIMPFHYYLIILADVAHHYQSICNHHYRQSPQSIVTITHKISFAISIKYHYHNIYQHHHQPSQYIVNHCYQSSFSTTISYHDHSPQCLVINYHQQSSPLTTTTSATYHNHHPSLPSVNTI